MGPLAMGPLAGYLLPAFWTSFFLPFLAAGAAALDLPAALAAPFRPNAHSQPSEYFFVVPTRTIVTVIPFTLLLVNRALWRLMRRVSCYRNSRRRSSGQVGGKASIAEPMNFVL
jgi:hypothetical protein